MTETALAGHRGIEGTEKQKSLLKMSDYQEFWMLMKTLDGPCVFPDVESVATEFFVLANFWPIFVGYLMLGLTVVKCNYEFLLLSASNFFDNWVNFTLRNWFGESDRYQPDTCPLLEKQMPALASQRIALLYTTIWFLATFTYPKVFGKSNMLFLNFSMVLALYSRLYLGFSTPLQMLVGSAFGVLEGLLLSLFFYYLKVHRYDQSIEALLRKWYTLFGDNPYREDTERVQCEKGMCTHTASCPYQVPII